jgi:hypothetical protein
MLVGTNTTTGITKSPSEDFVKETKNGANFKLTGTKIPQTENDIRELDDAISMAENSLDPSRFKLYSIYDNIRDLHVKSQMRTAIFGVVKQKWVIVDENNVIDEELTKLLQKLWFHELSKKIIETEFYGHSMIYFWMNEKTREIEKTKLFPRIHVNPEKGVLIPDLDREDITVPYDNEVFNSIFLEVGEPGDLGLLKDVARWCILKWWGIKDWARSSEKWGDPHLVIQSSSDDEAENTEKAEMAQNFGGNSWMMVSKEDEVKLLERNQAGASHLIFLDFIKISNEENSKGINGQTATADTQAFVGTAQVQERILDDYTESRLMSLMYFHNEKTLPFLINWNGGDTPYKALKGKKWVPLSMLDVKTDNSNNPTPGTPPTVKKPINKIFKNPFI